MREYSAVLNYAITSATKLELIAKLVRNKKVSDALHTLTYLPKKGGAIMEKVIRSAYANVLQASPDATDAQIARIDIGRGPKIKRMRFTSRARVYGYTKHRSFVRVVLSA